MSTRRAVAARRFVTGCSDGDAVAAEDVVELGLVVALALGQALDDEGAREPERAARELPEAGALHDDAPRRHVAAADLVARLAVDDRDRRVQDHARPQHGAAAHTGPFGD